jgi:hypothetical protein
VIISGYLNIFGENSFFIVGYISREISPYQRSICGIDIDDNFEKLTEELRK